MVNSSALDYRLLQPDAPTIENSDELYSWMNARGVYSPTRFAVQLSDEIHRLIENIPTGIHSTNDLSRESIQAFSTYLHETVHWWQHMGSTSGLVQSLVYPAQAHQNSNQLGEVLKLAGPKKSLKIWAEDSARAGKSADDPALAAANVAVNNAVDLEFYKVIACNPNAAVKAIESPYFESVGHSYWMAYGHTVALISATIDRQNEYLPDGRSWDDGFRRIREEQVNGFVHGGEVSLANLGLAALFEGQARFLQLQYLTFGVKAPPTLDQLRADGYLTAIYGEAFKSFLEITRLDWPKTIDDPAVALFLLIVDLSINPTVGFPLDIECFEDFIIDVDPGIRFIKLCQSVRTQPNLISAITDYSRDEYIKIAELLTDACGYDHPFVALNRVVEWARTAPGIKKILEEKASFLYEEGNLVVRVLFSHFVDFCVDKFHHPEFFCWAGAWMAGARASRASQELFLRHLSLYTNRPDAAGIFPRLFPGKDEAGTIKTLNLFYGNVVLYDLTKQWTLTPGGFVYNYAWLSGTHSTEELEDWAKQLFAGVYGVSPDEFEILPTSPKSN